MVKVVTVGAVVLGPTSLITTIAVRFGVTPALAATYWGGYVGSSAGIRLVCQGRKTTSRVLLGGYINWAVSLGNPSMDD